MPSHHKVWCFYARVLFSANEYGHKTSTTSLPSSSGRETVKKVRNSTLYLKSLLIMFVSAELDTATNSQPSTPLPSGDHKNDRARDKTSEYAAHAVQAEIPGHSRPLSPDLYPTGIAQPKKRKRPHPAFEGYSNEQVQDEQSTATLPPNQSDQVQITRPHEDMNGPQIPEVPDWTIHEPPSIQIEQPFTFREIDFMQGRLDMYNQSSIHTQEPFSFSEEEFLQNRWRHANQTEEPFTFPEALFVQGRPNICNPSST